jgi:chromosome segregation ATPase
MRLVPHETEGHKIMWYLTGGLGLALAITGGAFKLYYDKSEAEKEAIALQLRQAADNQVLLENSIKGLNDQVIAAEEEKKIAFEKINVLQEQNEEAREQVQNLKDKFQKHDMNLLSLRKPKLIENIINKGTKGVLNEFENLTDSKPSS